ncbi:MAG: type II toxin-antitoxin system VapC family toxin [Deferribacteres bacterium]|nr:type II toxin-antitoxin system VapC family toxin [Deferribacteres bacterium]
MKTYVLDTSVIIKWFSEYNEDDLDKALILRTRILQDKCSVIVPALMFYELANALRYNTRFTDEDVKDAVKSVIDMGFSVKDLEASVIARAVEIAFRYGVTVYDAYFLALSQIEKKPFITADYKFIKRIRGFKNIMRLSET